MAVYAITGKLGSGKGKGAMQRLREHVRAGRRVATNSDVFMEHLDHERSKGTVIRVPDKPTASDLYLIGSGNPFIEFEVNVQHSVDSWKGLPPVAGSMKMLPGFDESHNGALFLDECGSWLNTRTFQDKGRGELLEWMIHARKYGWDVYFQMQNINQVDKQLREALFEYVVRMNRLDKMRVPLVSSAVGALTAGAVSGNLPRVHIGVVRIGSNPDGIVADRWVFRGDDLHDAYSTTQVFSDQYPHGTHTLLSPWHLSCKTGVPSDFVGPIRPGALDHELLKPRALPLKPPHPHMTKFLVGSMLVGCLLGAAGLYMFGPSEPPPKPVTVAAAKANPVPTKDGQNHTDAIGFVQQGGYVLVFLSDGTVQEPMSFAHNGKTWKAVLSSGQTVTGSGGFRP